MRQKASCLLAFVLVLSSLLMSSAPAATILWVSDNKGGDSTDQGWIKIERTGDDFRGYYSQDGIAWTAMSWNPQTIPMITDVYIGLAVTSHNAIYPTTAQYSSLSTTGSVSGPWLPVDIGATLPVPNAADKVYVAVEDSSQRIQRVSHPDPSATTMGVWTQWNIPLSTFTSAGIDLSRVKKMVIGVGDHNTPKTGDKGQLYIDDIRTIQGMK